VLWLKADAGITQSGGLITLWADQSGNGSDASSSAGARPTFNASSINGLPGVTFGPAGVFMNNVVTNPVGVLAARHLIVVCKMTTGTSTGAPFCFRRNTTDAALGWQTIAGSNYIYSDGVNAGSNTTVPVGPSAATPYALEWSFDGVSGHNYTFAHNGTSETTTASGGATSESGTDGYYVGTTPPTVASFQGDVCEVLIYDHVLSGPDLAAVRGYILSRYGIV
jgi:hypothetical protein